MFKVRPVLDLMIDFYEHPRNQERFDLYLKMLQGNSKRDMELPIGGYNPMAKEHLSGKLKALKQLNAEEIISETLLNVPSTREYEVVINLADDLLGGWTNKFTTDYQSKFQLNPLIQRGFCTPYFWSSEKYSETLIRERSLAAAYRTTYFEIHGKSETLEEHVNQENWVAEKCGTSKSENQEVQSFLETIKHTTDYSIIIAFLYGDDAAENLGFRKLGHSKFPLIHH